jgi:branched-chain amino acid transport system ATP-binding protein
VGSSDARDRTGADERATAAPARRAVHGAGPPDRGQIFEIIASINNDGTTVLLVEQNAAQALKLARCGYVLETGEIVMSDDAQTLLCDDRVRAAYLGEEIGTR